MQNITKDELENIYYSNTNKIAAELLGVSKVTLIEMIKRAGVKQKGKGYCQKYLIV